MMIEEQKMLGLTKTEAVQTIAGDGDKNVQVPDFEKKTFKHFDVEFGLKDKAIVVHFFKKDEMSQGYWETAFGQVLSDVAQAHFNAGYPRLRAAFVPDFELNSWWFSAQGYEHLLDLDGYVLRFLERLDEKTHFGAPPSGRQPPPTSGGPVPLRTSPRPSGRA